MWMNSFVGVLSSSSWGWKSRRRVKVCRLGGEGLLPAGGWLSAMERLYSLNA